jgi:hypothetical protein
MGTICWDVTPCSAVEVYEYSGRKYCHNFWGLKRKLPPDFMASISDDSTLLVNSRENLKSNHTACNMYRKANSKLEINVVFLSILDINVNLSP